MCEVGTLIAACSLPFVVFCGSWETSWPKDRLPPKTTGAWKVFALLD